MSNAQKTEAVKFDHLKEIVRALENDYRFAVESGDQSAALDIYKRLDAARFDVMARDVFGVDMAGR